MNLDKMIESGTAIIDGIEKRFGARDSAKAVEKMSAEAISAHAARIEQRIARLDQQRAVTLARIDAALESEHAALRSLRAVAETAPQAMTEANSKPTRPAPAKAAKRR